MTSYPKQAERWAIRKFMRLGKGEPVVNVYNFNDDYDKYQILKFKTPEDNEKWLDFVCACRDGKEVYMNYDIIIGEVADDDVFKSIDMYQRGVWDKQKTLEELKYFNNNNQIVFINQKAIDNLLIFKLSFKVRIK